MTFDLSVLMGVVALGLGVVFGMVSSVKLIRIAFKKYTSECIYAIVGLVAGLGSYSLWTYNTSKPTAFVRDF